MQTDMNRRVLLDELTHVVDALGAITASAEVLVLRKPEPAAPALRELAAIVDAVGAIAESVRAAFVALDVAAGETTPDVFPAAWCEGA